MLSHISHHPPLLVFLLFSACLSVFVTARCHSITRTPIMPLFLCPCHHMGEKKASFTVYSSYPSPNLSEPEIKLFCNSQPVMRCQRHFTLWQFCSCSDSQPKLLQVCFMRLFTLNAWLASTLKTAKVLSLTVAHPKQCHGWVHREYSFIYCRTVCLTHPSNQIQKGFYRGSFVFLGEIVFPPKSCVLTMSHRSCKTHFCTYHVLPIIKLFHSFIFFSTHTCMGENISSISKALNMQFKLFVPVCRREQTN